MARQTCQTLRAAFMHALTKINSGLNLATAKHGLTRIRRVLHMLLFVNVNALINVEPRAASTGINTCHICLPVYGVQLIVLICQLHVCMTVSIHAKQH